MPETTGVAVLTAAVDSVALLRWLNRPEQARTVVLASKTAFAEPDHPRVATFADDARHKMGGCVCCGPPGDLTRMLRAMLPRARRGEIDRVVILTGGATDSARILAALNGDPVVAAVYRADGTSIAI